MIMKKTSIIVILFLLAAARVFPQSLTIEQCMRWAKKLPLIRQKELLVKSMEFTIANARSAYCHRSPSMDKRLPVRGYAASVDKHSRGIATCRAVGERSIQDIWRGSRKTFMMGRDKKPGSNAICNARS